jgi:hypothetical protein
LLALAQVLLLVQEQNWGLGLLQQEQPLRLA